jgi:hypothetical protein
VRRDNVEVAHKLSEPEHGRNAPHRGRWHDVIETAEVVLLAVVAIATAYSGFQAALWEGHQSMLYGEASNDRFDADAAATRSGQVLVGNLTLFASWLQAASSGDAQLQAVLVRRMTPEYPTAFTAWLATDPFTNPDAPAGPSYMPEYQDPLVEEAARLNERSRETFDHGTEARHTADRYIRDTVLFAMVLFLVAMPQRFQTHAARIAANGVAGALLVFVLASVAQLPRI